MSASKKTLGKIDVEGIVKESFNKFNSELFNELKKAGCPDLKAIGYATDISDSLNKTFVRRGAFSNPDVAVQEANKLSQMYLAKFREEASKEKVASQNKALYSAQEAYFDTLGRYFDISCSLSSRGILPGCFEFGKRR
jgi:hypothetical protein